MLLAICSVLNVPTNSSTTYEAQLMIDLHTVIYAYQLFEAIEVAITPLKHYIFDAYSKVNRLSSLMGTLNLKEHSHPGGHWIFRRKHIEGKLIDKESGNIVI